jgi:hypothetical protein
MQEKIILELTDSKKEALMLVKDLMEIDCIAPSA